MAERDGYSAPENLTMFNRISECNSHLISKQAEKIVEY